MAILTTYVWHIDHTGIHMTFLSACITCVKLNTMCTTAVCEAGLWFMVFRVQGFSKAQEVAWANVTGAHIMQWCAEAS